MLEPLWTIWTICSLWRLSSESKAVGIFLFLSHKTHKTLQQTKPKAYTQKIILKKEIKSRSLTGLDSVPLSFNCKNNFNANNINVNHSKLPFILIDSLFNV